MSKHDQKALILNEARSLFLESGEKGLSMRKLAASIGVTPAAIYWHFKNKEELLGEIFLEGVETFSRYMNKSWRGTTHSTDCSCALRRFLRLAWSSRAITTFFS